MRQHKEIIIKNILKIIHENCNENQNLDFLYDVMDFVNKIRDKSFPEETMRKTHVYKNDEKANTADFDYDNYIMFLGGREKCQKHYYDLLFQEYHRIYEIRYNQDKNLKEINKANIVDLGIIENKIPENYFELYFKEVLFDLNNHEGRKNPRWNSLKEYLVPSDSITTIIQVLKTSLKFAFMQVYRKNLHENNEETLSCNTTSLYIKVGTNLFEYFICKNKLLKKFLNLKNDIITYKNITKKDKELFISFLKNINNNETLEIHRFFKDQNQSIDLGSPKTNKIIYTLIRNYVLMTFKQIYKEENITIEQYSESYNNFIIEIAKFTSILLGQAINTYKTKTSLILPPLFLEKLHNKEKIKTKKIYSINPLIWNHVNFLKHSLNKPFLKKTNIKFMEKHQKNNHIIKAIFEHKRKFIHPNPSMELRINEESYLVNNKPLTYLTIDIVYLQYILSLLVRFFSSKDLEQLMFFCSSLYNITFNDIKEVPETKEFIDLQKHLLTLSATFNLKEEQRLDKICKNLLNSSKQKSDTKSYKYTFYLSMYNKIKNQKLLLKGFLQDCIFYMIFDYFIEDGFLDSRGRFYNNSDFMNIQLFPITKTLIKPFKIKKKIELSEEDFNKIKNTIQNHFCSKTIKTTNFIQNFKNLTFQKYKKQIEQNKIDYILKYLKNKEEFNDSHLKEKYNELISYISNYEKNPENIVDFSFIELLNTFIKKKNRTLYVQSTLMCYLLGQQPTYFNLDATASGLQMCSIFLKSHQLASQCSLIESSSDIYENISKNFYENINLLYKQKFMEDFESFFEHKPNILNIDNLTYDFRIHYDYNFDNKSIITLVYDFLKLDLDKSSYTTKFLKILIHKFSENVRLKKSLPEFLSKNKFLPWLIPQKEKRLLKSLKLNKEENKILYIFLYYRNVKKIEKLSTLFPEKTKFFTLFSKRSLFKQALMTYFYNSTSYGRKEYYNDFIFENIPNVIDIFKFQNVVYLSELFERFFMFFIKNNLSDSKKLFKISDILADTNKSVRITNEFFELTYCPKIQKTVTIEMPQINNKRGSQLNFKLLTNTFNKKDFDNGFIPNFIHSLDAFVAHSFLKLLYEINLELSSHNIHIFCSTNHDNFITTLDKSPFLKYLVEYCYLSLYYLDPLTFLTKTLDENTKEKINNIRNKVEKNEPLVLEELSNNFIK